jgi:7-carboxy-7-deazaguanine synthase
LKINEIFYSIQGEGTNAGRPCIFIRTSGCNLNCNWCDTKYHTEYEEMPVKKIVQELDNWNCSLVEITGGEPFLQSDILELVDTLLELGYEVNIETNGTQHATEVSDDVKLVVDIKCPSSGNAWNVNTSKLLLDELIGTDEIKFVVADDVDLKFASNMIHTYLKSFQGTILFSPVFGKMDLNKLVNFVKKLCDNRVRVQVQLHKIIWGNKKGV